MEGCDGYGVRAGVVGRFVDCSAVDDGGGEDAFCGGPVVDRGGRLCLRIQLPLVIPPGLDQESIDGGGCEFPIAGA